MSKLEVGATAPAFTLTDHDENKISLKDFKDQRLVLYFYPEDDSPGCTTEACQFSDNIKLFNKAKVTVLGVSPDHATSHLNFRKKHGLAIRLLSDPTHKIMEKYGAWGEKTLYGKTVVGVIRSTFLIGINGKIEKVWYNVKADGHAEKVLAALG